MRGRRPRRRSSLLRSLFPTPKPRRRTRRTPAARLTPVAPAALRPPPARKRPAAEPAARPVAVPATSGRWHQARSGGHPYAVYLPRGLRRGRPVPLLVLLHGCGQGPADFAAATRFNEVADRNGFLVAYPEQTVAHNSQRCWNWFERGHQGRGAGEPAAIAAITGEVVAETKRWRVDTGRVYVAGLSAGGAMAMVLGATYPDVYAAVGVHSAPPYGSAGSRTGAWGAMAGHGQVNRPGVGPSGMPPTVVVQGSRDTVVRASNSGRVTDQWLAFHAAAGAGPTDPGRIVRSASSTRPAGQDRGHTVTRWYTADGHKRLEVWQIDGLAHAWSGGLPGGSFTDPRGPRASTLMWRFLSAQRLPGADAEVPRSAAR